MGSEALRGSVGPGQAILELAGKRGAVLYGDFTLASGKKSDHYWDGKKVTLDPAGAYLVAMTILDLIAPLEVDAIGGLEIGAIPIAASVAVFSCQSSRPIPAFIVRKHPKEHGTRSEVEGYALPGKRVVIVDDVITSGESILKAIGAVEERGCSVVKVIVLVDRHEGGSDLIRKRGYSFQSILDFQTVGGKTQLGVSATNSSGLKEELLC